MLSLVRALLYRATAAAVAGTLVLSTAPASGAVTIDEITAKALRAWNGEPELVADVYAPDAVHTATFRDRTTTYEGPEAIERVARGPGVEPVGPRIDLPAGDGELRWVSFTSLAGGSACLWHAVDGRVIRQDCLVPEPSSGAAAPAAAKIDGPSPEVLDLMSRLDAAWGPGSSIETLAAVYAPDAVHSARHSTATSLYEGPDEIIRVAAYPREMERIGPIVEFEAPDGELAWASVNDLAGGSVCRFEAVNGMVTRHDCLLPFGA